MDFKKPYKCIYNLRLAGFLMMNKQPLIRIERNLDRPNKNVFLFNDTKELEVLIEEYKQKSKEVLKNGSYISSSG